jgi:hypothetical protein
MLDSLHGGPDNLHRLSLEIPEKKHLPNFDPELEFTDEQWATASVYLEACRKDGNFDSYVIAVGQLAVISKEKATSLVTEDDWVQMIRTLRIYQNVPYAKLLYASSMAQLDPTRTAQYMNTEGISRMIENSSGKVKITQIRRFYCINPQEAFSLLPANWVESLGSPEERKGSIEYLGLVALFDPHKLPDISADEWDEFRKKFRETRGLGHYITGAWLTLISRAEEAKRANDFSAKIPEEPMPEILSF